MIISVKREKIHLETNTNIHNIITISMSHISNSNNDSEDMVLAKLFPVNIPIILKQNHILLVFTVASHVVLL